VAVCIGQDALLSVEEEIRILSLKESQQRHSLSAWQKLPDSVIADQEVTRLQAQILLEKTKGEEVSSMLESTCNTFRYATFTLIRNFLIGVN